MTRTTSNASAAEVSARMHSELARAMDRMGFTSAQRTVLILVAIGTIFDAIEQFNVAYAAPSITQLWNLSSTQVGFLSTATFGGVAVGCLIAGITGDLFGRKVTYMYNLALYTFGALIGALAPNYEVLILGRIIVGIGLGGELNTGVTLVSEIVSTRFRGASTAVVNIAGGGVGIFMSAALAWVMITLLGDALGGPTESWRWMLGILVLPSLMVLVYRRYLPESPRYLLSRGRVEEANRVLTLLDAGRLRDDGRPTKNWITAPEGVEMPRERVQFSDILRGSLLRNTIVLWVISFMAFGAQDTITIFMPSILVKQGYAIASSLSFTLIINIGGLIGALLAAAAGHYLKRRVVLSTGAVLAVVVAIGFVSAPNLAVVLAFGIGFMTMSMLLNTLIWVYAPELYPTRVRAFGVGTSVFVASAAGSIIPPFAGNVLDLYGAMGIFGLAGIMYVIVALAVWFGPETLGQSLEELNEAEKSDVRECGHERVAGVTNTSNHEEFGRLSAAGLATAIRQKRASATSLVQGRLDLISSSKLNAVVTLNPNAEEEAARADAALERGDRLGPLHGVPFTVKDTLDTAGIRTTAGSATLVDRVPGHTATAVRRLQDAGAILLGKTNCSEFAVDTHTDNPLFGPTLNPRDPSRTPGGSSGGEASAVAAGLSAFGIGTDFGGSIRWPSQCTGVFGLRPTPGLVPGTGTLPCFPENARGIPNRALLLHQLMTAGPMARSSTDLALILSVIAGADGLDAGCVDVALPDPSGVDLKGVEIAWCPGEGTTAVAGEVVDTLSAAASALAGRGVPVRKHLPDGLDEAAALFVAARDAEGMPEVEAMIAGGEASLGAFMRSYLQGAEQGPFSDVVGFAAQRYDLRARVLASLGSASILLLPVAAVPAPKPGLASVAVGTASVPWSGIGACCRAISILGFPAASVPFGRSADGLPINVQVVGRPFRDHEVLAVAAMLEDCAEFRWNP